MFDTIQKLKYHAGAGVTQAQEELNSRLNDRMELPLPGLHGEKLYLTGVTALWEKAAELKAMYARLPAHCGVKDTILLDAFERCLIDAALSGTFIRYKNAADSAWESAAIDFYTNR